ncbi:Bax inhibitor-1 family protein [Gammaproteobacteria bacterium]|nr:Bax inhibitor-1 family protein [Gammaproteobacteria bacterium]MDC0420864.1 Bax inhibitor-1 family protein [Gammaproteobacteria bacterium]MDC1170992.1 Bax inhibitor-1 family protein [Gammaproteobacteria bacterium]
MFVETSLFFKTMLILCSQISVILAICFYCIREARKAYENDTSFAGMYFKGSMNLNKQLDLVPYSPSPEYYPSEMFKMVQSKDNPTKSDTLIVMAMNSEHRIELIKDGYMDKSGGNYFYAAFLLWIISSSLCTLFATTGISTQTGIIFFTTSSITFGFLLSIIMLEMDENDGFNALKIVFLVTLITGFIGYSDVYSFSESSSLALFLLISLLGLIGFEFIRIFRGFSRWAIRIKAIFGAFVFSVFLLFDFNLLKKKSDFGVNDWDNAFNIAFEIYLDIINLLLEILDASSN